MSTDRSSLAFRLAIPPAAVFAIPHTRAVAGPIAAFWLAGLLMVLYGVTQIATALGASVLFFGVFFWWVSFYCAGLVTAAAAADLHHDPHSPLAKRVEPSTDDPLDTLNPH